VSFRTIFPGFYMGRTNHIHFKVRIDGHAAGKSYQAGHTSHIGQIFFPEETATELMKHEPYSRHKVKLVVRQLLLTERDARQTVHQPLSVVVVRSVQNTSEVQRLLGGYRMRRSKIDSQMSITLSPAEETELSITSAKSCFLM
jgi:protocatechuate 3,4-dioxygenase beta subunit